MNVEAAETGRQSRRIQQEEQVQQEEQIQQIQELELGLYVKEVFLLDFYDPSEGGWMMFGRDDSYECKNCFKLMQYE